MIEYSRNIAFEGLVAGVFVAIFVLCFLEYYLNVDDRKYLTVTWSFISIGVGLGIFALIAGLSPVIATIKMFFVVLVLLGPIAFILPKK